MDKGKGNGYLLPCPIAVKFTTSATKCNEFRSS